MAFVCFQILVNYLSVINLIISHCTVTVYRRSTWQCSCRRRTNLWSRYLL